MIGHKAGRWGVRDWINSGPLTLEELRGKVVLVRWWTAPGCPFCEASAPALNEFSQRYGDRGLVVIGFYHHKSPTPLSVAHVKSKSASLVSRSSGNRSRLDHAAKLVAGQTRSWLDIGDHSSRPPRGDQARPPGWCVLQRRDRLRQPSGRNRNPVGRAFDVVCWRRIRESVGQEWWFRCQAAGAAAATNRGFGIREVFMKVRPEKPKPGRCVTFWVER